MRSRRFWLKGPDEESKSIPHLLVKGDMSVRNRALLDGDNAEAELLYATTKTLFFHKSIFIFISCITYRNEPRHEKTCLQGI